MPTPFRLLTRRTGAVGLALTAYDIWRRIPPAQRRQILAVTRTHGPRLAASAVKRGRAARAPKRPR
jgi:hypothetical protein